MFRGVEYYFVGQDTPFESWLGLHTVRVLHVVDCHCNGALFTEKRLGEKYYIEVDGFVGLLVPFVFGQVDDLGRDVG